MEKLLTIDQVAELLQIPKGSIYNLVHEDRIPHLKIGGRLRFQESSLQDWLKKYERKEKAPVRVDI